MEAKPQLASEGQPKTGNSAMILKTGSGWTRGLENLLSGELRRWFGTRTWLVQIIIWAMAINFIFLMVALNSSGGDMSSSDSIMIFNIFLGLVGPIGVSILMQSAVVEEKNSGTAAWVLSKPVSRIAFILSKMISNVIGVGATMLVAQGLIAYLIAALVLHLRLPVLGFVAGLGVHLINILFYLTLTLMLGAIYNHGAPVIGIPLAFLFMQQYLASYLASIYAPLSSAFPWTLAIPLNNSQDLPVAGALMVGAPVATYLGVVTTLVFSILFTGIALRVFQSQEL